MVTCSSPEKARENSIDLAECLTPCPLQVGAIQQGRSLWICFSHLKSELSPAVQPMLLQLEKSACDLL